MSVVSPPESSRSLEEATLGGSRRVGEPAGSSSSTHKKSLSKPKRLQSASLDELLGVWKCRYCGWTYPDSRPNAQQRREHKRDCQEALQVLKWPEEVPKHAGFNGTTGEGALSHENSQAEEKSTPPEKLTSASLHICASGSKDAMSEQAAQHANDGEPDGRLSGPGEMTQNLKTGEANGDVADRSQSSHKTEQRRSSFQSSPQDRTNKPDSFDFTWIESSDVGEVEGIYRRGDEIHNGAEDSEAKETSLEDVQSLASQDDVTTQKSCDFGTRLREEAEGDEATYTAIALGTNTVGLDDEATPNAASQVLDAAKLDLESPLTTATVVPSLPDANWEDWEDVIRGDASTMNGQMPAHHFSDNLVHGEADVSGPVQGLNPDDIVDCEPDRELSDATAMMGYQSRQALKQWAETKREALCQDKNTRADANSSSEQGSSAASRDLVKLSLAERNWDDWDNIVNSGYIHINTYKTLLLEKIFDDVEVPSESRGVEMTEPAIDKEVEDPNLLSTIASELETGETNTVVVKASLAEASWEDWEDVVKGDDAVLVVENTSTQNEQTSQDQTPSAENASTCNCSEDPADGDSGRKGELRQPLMSSTDESQQEVSNGVPATSQQKPQQTKIEYLKLPSVRRNWEDWEDVVQLKG